MIGILLALTLLLFGSVLSHAEEEKGTLPDNGLPVVIIEINEEEGHTIEDMNTSPDHSVNCYGSIQILVPEGFSLCDLSFSQESTGSLELDYIRGRGNTTWLHEKKPYKIKLKDKANLFGLGKNKHWVLLANVYDHTLIRNRLTAWLGEGLCFSFTPRGVPVDVVMVAKQNGEEVGRTNLGNYLLAEQVRVDENRLELPELKKKHVDEKEITGGYLIQFGQQVKENDPDHFYTDRGVNLANDSPTFDPSDEDYTNEAQKEYIRTYIQDMENAIFGVNVQEDGDVFTNEKGIRYNEYMDMETAATYWLIQELCNNPDGFESGSNYFYKTADTYDEGGTLIEKGKIYWGPLWDFDMAWGGNYMDYQPDEFSFTSDWILAMLYDKNQNGFYEAVLKAWPLVKERILDAAKDGGLLDQYYEEEKDSFAKDYEIWKDILPNHYARRTSYEDNIQKQKEWIKDRVAWMDEEITGGALGSAVVKVCYMEDETCIRREYYQKGAMIELYVPGSDEHGFLPEKEGYVFAGWIAEDGNTASSREEAACNRVFTATFVTEDEATHAEDIVFLSEKEWCPSDKARFTNPYTILPEDAMEKKVSFSSSDESIAIVDETGTVYPQKAGTVTITARLKSGMERSYELIITDGEQPQMQDITIAPEELTLTKGKSAHIDVTVFPFLAEKDNVWFFTKDENVTADFSGVIFAEEEGDAVIEVLAVCYGDEEEDTIRIWKYVTIHVIEEEITYSFSEGEGSVWTKGDDSPMNLTVVRSMDNASAFALLKDVYVDGLMLDKGSYEAASGSVHIALKADYLKTLAEGTHTLFVTFDDGKTSEMTFTVQAGTPEKEESRASDGSVNTDDESAPYLWILLMGLSLAAGLAALLIVRIKKRF